MNAKLNASDLRWLHSLDLSISICIRMEELGMSKSELANRAGMKLSSLSRIIAGEQNMTLATIAKLEHALDVRFDGGFRYGQGKKNLESSSTEGEIPGRRNHEKLPSYDRARFVSIDESSSTPLEGKQINRLGMAA